jgi:molybdopterin-containing oxidoreductase family iron-sulfur binding subunit
MEKCTFCIQRIRRTGRDAKRDGQEIEDGDRALNPACVNACPTGTLVFGDLNDEDSEVARMAEKELHGDHGRGYHMLEELGTHPSVIYLRKIDKSAKLPEEAHG